MVFDQCNNCKLKADCTGCAACKLQLNCPSSADNAAECKYFVPDSDCHMYEKTRN